MYVRGRARFPDEVSSKARRDRSFKDVRSSAYSPARGLRPACALFFKGKVSRNSKNAYQTPKLRAVWRQSPTPPISIGKGEGKKHDLLAAGPAGSIGTFSWNLEV
jgi:hypothetical protein